MTKIRVGIYDDHSLEVDIDKQFEEIETSDVYEIIGREKRIMGWCKIGD